MEINYFRLGETNGGLRFIEAKKERIEFCIDCVE